MIPLQNLSEEQNDSVLPCRGSRYGSPSVHQHTPAVTSGLVALDRLVEALQATVRDEDGFPWVLLSLILSGLPLLVTRGNFL